MAKTKISEFSATPANNTDIDSINIAEGCSPSGINDAIRELMAQLKDWQSGTSNDPYVVGSSGSLTLNQGTANGVAYLNGSKVVTSGSALTFDGTNFTVGASATTGDYKAFIQKAGGELLGLNASSGTLTRIAFGNATASFGSTQIIANASDLAFITNSSEQMRLTSTGLGIGTSSVGSKLSINAASGENVITYSLAGSAKAYIGVSAGAGQIIDNSVANDYCVRSSGNILFSAGGQYEKLRLDSSGNLGLGVTPSAWAFRVAQQIGAAASISAAGGSNSSLAEFGANRYLNSSGNEIYIGNNFATLYQQVNGSHAWFRAPSGTAGNAITFTQAMTLDADSVLSIAGTKNSGYNSAFKVQIGADTGTHGLMIRGAETYLSFDDGTSGFGSGRIYYNASSDYMAFSTSATECARINSSGNMGIGTTSPAQRLTIAQTNGYPVIDFNNSGTAYGDVGFQVDKMVLSAYSSTPLTFWTNSAERARIDSSGRFMVGTTSAVTEAKLSAIASSSGQAAAFKSDASTSVTIVNLWGNEASGNQIFIRFATDSNQERGSISYNRGAGLVAYNVTSDYRAKDINGPVTNSGALIDSVPVYMGKMKGATQERPMFIAHETPAYAHTGEKDAVDENGNPVYQQMDASALIPVMWAEIQSLRQRVAQLESN